jgi:hypothetical protein
MGPRCSSAETQVCHRSYIIAARFPVSALSQCEEVEDDPDDDIPLAQLCNMVRQGSELIYDQMDEIESSLPTEETYDGDWQKSLLNKFKSRNVSDDEESNGEVELEEEAVDLIGSEFSYEDDYVSFWVCLK